MNDNLPKGWAEISLEAAGFWRSGGTPSRRRPEFFGKGVPWVKSGDLPDGLILRTEEEITELGLQNSSAKLMPAGTISMALYGATIGKLGVMTFPAATNQACANIIPDKRSVDSKYLFYYLLSERRTFIEQGQGGAQPNISQEIVRSHPFRLAPLVEQRRIVAKLEPLLAKVLACQKRLENIPTILKRFRQAVLAAACSGRLTADWRERNVTVPLTTTVIEKLKETVVGKKIRRGVPESVAVSDVVAEWQLPETWGSYSTAELLRFGAFVDVKDGNHGANHPKVSQFTETGLPFITAAQVNKYSIDYDGAYKLSGEPLKRIRVGLAKSGDVIYTHKGSVGRVAVADRTCVLTPQTTYYRVNPKVFLNRFVMFYLASQAFSEQVNVVKEQTTRDFVPISEQYLLFHRVPPLPEQQEIVRRVESLFNLVDRIEARYNKAKAQVEKLTQSTLAKAFRGELVTTEAELAEEEGRSYESAADLLARITSIPEHRNTVHKRPSTPK
jgi:type I restriction enzyme S subunit